MRISGATKLLGILADPVVQARTPELLNSALDVRGIDAVLVPMHVRAGGFHAAIAGLRTMQNFAGAVVSMPHKRSVPELMDHLTDAAAQVGACNVIRRTPEGHLVGTMLDGLGFVSGLRSAGIDPGGRRVFLAGAGGAAAGIAFAVAAAGATLLTIHNRTGATRDALAAALRHSFPGLAIRTDTSDPGGHDLVVNGTSLGMRPDDPLPVVVERLSDGAIAAEAVLAPEETRFLKAAAARGHRIHRGREMLEAQIGMMIDFMLDQAT